MVTALKSVADWYTIGLKLGVAIQDLDEIKTIQGGGQKKKEAMFESWIQELRRNGEEPTWQRILDVLTKLVIEKPIQDIKRRYRECVFCVHVLRGQKIGSTATIMHAMCL